MVIQPSEDSNFQENLTKVVYVQQSMDILDKVVERLREHDYVSAQIMVGVVRQTLDELQTELEQHVSLAIRLQDMLQPRQREIIRE